MLCRSCPRGCDIGEGEQGKCFARALPPFRFIPRKIIETNPAISTMIYGPIEQKLYHYMPGAKLLSVGFYGCNFSCLCCQNWEISQERHPAPEDRGISWVSEDPSGAISRSLARKSVAALAFTYTEPAIYPNFVSEAFGLAHAAGKRTILKTNACVATKDFEKILRETDAVNIDVKGDPKTYEKVCGVPKKSFGLVMENLELAKRTCHVEVSVPALRATSNWKSVFAGILCRSGERTPIRLLRIYPDYKMGEDGVMGSEIQGLAALARQYFEHVYIDDAAGDVNTTCPSCKIDLIRRTGIRVEKKELWRVGEKGECLRCGHDCNIRTKG